ncbi:MAG: molybdenum cofactor guanylyltransferase [Gemmatimonadota bacterium]
MSAPPLGVVLAGGRSRRFGSDKRAAVLEGHALLERATRTLRAVTPHVVVSVGADDPSAREDTSDGPGPGGAGLPRVLDPLPDVGPLGGLLAGLRDAERRGLSGVLVLAVDLPLVEPAHLSRLQPAGSDAPQAILASAADGTRQPLCGWYDARVRSGLQTWLAGGGRAVLAFVETLAPDWVVVDDRDGVSPLLNVNTPEDLDRAHRARGQRDPEPRAPRIDPSRRVAPP